MDDSIADQKVNDTPSDVKQNCVENTNSLPPTIDNSVAKKTSFEITSITEPNNDDNDEDSPDTDSLVHEHRADNRHDVELQNYADNMVVYSTSNDLGSSAPVIPTSSQYGLAIVDNSDSSHTLGSNKGEDIHGVDVNSQKNECDLNGLQNKNRNERFKVVKIESTEPFKRGRWVCMDFLDHSMNQQQPGNNKIIMVNGDNKPYSQANDLDSTEPLDNGHHDCPEFRVCTNNVSTYTSNCNTSDNYKNQTSTYNIVSSGVTTPIHSACVSPGQSLQSNMQVPLVTSQPVAASVQTPQPQSLTQIQLSAQHNINQSGIPHSSLQSHQIQQVIANSGVMQPQLQQTQPVINVMQNQNSTIQSQSIQHLNSVDQHVTQTMPQQYQQSMSQANLQQQIMQHNIPAQFQKSFVSPNQTILPNCAPLQQSVNQMINQQVPQYYNSPSVQSQNVTSESSTTVPISNQHISQQQFQSIPIQNQSLQNHVQLQQNQQQIPLPVQQMQQQPNPQQTIVQQNQIQSQMVQQNQQLSHQPSISQPNQPQQTQSVPQQTQQMSQQHIQQTQPTPQPQQTHVQQVPSSQQQQSQQQQGSQQMQQVGQQIQGQGSQIQQQLPQQTHHITQLTQMPNQSQQMTQSNQMQQITQQSQQISQQPQINLQSQQISQQTQIQHPKQMQTTQIQSQPQQMNQQQIPQQQQIGQITSQNQMIHQNNQQITHTGQMISQQTINQAQLNQNQQVQQQQQQPQQQIQQQLAQTSQSGQSMTQQILQPNQSMPQQNQVLTQQLGINQSNSQMSVPQSQNQQVIQSQQPQHLQQPGQQYQQPQQMMQSQPQQLPMQTNQPLMHQPTYSQAQSLNAIQLQQAVMQQIPTNTVTSTQMHIQQQQPVVPSNMMQQSQMNVMPQNNIQPTMPMSQQQMTYSLQQHVPINPNYVNSMQNCYIPSQQQMTYKPSIKTVEAVNKKKEDSNSEDVDNGTPNNATTTVAIDNKIEQAMDLVKSHLMYAVREEVEVLKEKIAELMDKVGLLETENSNLRMLVPPDILEQYNREKQKPTNSQSTHNQ